MLKVVVLTVLAMVVLAFLIFLINGLIVFWREKTAKWKRDEEAYNAQKFKEMFDE